MRNTYKILAEKYMTAVDTDQTDLEQENNGADLQPNAGVAAPGAGAQLETECWYDAEGNEDVKGCYDAYGHYHPDRQQDYTGFDTKRKEDLPLVKAINEARKKKPVKKEEGKADKKPFEKNKFINKLHKADDRWKGLAKESPASPAPAKPTTKPGTPTKPSTPGTPSPTKDPFFPKPGQSPRPKAESEGNPDLTRFVAKRTHYRQ